MYMYKYIYFKHAQLYKTNIYIQNMLKQNTLEDIFINKDMYTGNIHLYVN